METQSYLDDYQKVNKVLSSCKDKNHLRGAMKYFDLFVSKWKSFLSDSTLEGLRMDFEIDLAYMMIRMERGKIV